MNQTNYFMLQKSLLKCLFLILLGVEYCMPFTYAQNVCIPISIGTGDENTEVIIRPRESSPSGAPRGPVFNPFTAFLQNNNVILESDSSFGLVNVVLISTAGDYYTVVFDTEDVSIQIPVSGNSGYYCLCLTTESGMEFYGEFNM